MGVWDVSSEVECQLVADVLLSVPLCAVRNGLSDVVVVPVSDPRVLELARLRGGGVSDTSRPSCDPLEIVTGAPSPSGIPATFIPNPSPPLDVRASRSAALKLSSMSVIELVLLSELIRLGGMTRRSACGRYVDPEIALSSITRELRVVMDGRRESELEPESDTTSAISDGLSGAM